MVLALTGAVAAAQTDPGFAGKPSGAACATPSAAEIDAIYPDIEALYIDLHRNPELAFQETQTAAKLAARMKALGFDVTTGVGRTGIVAVMKNGAGPTVDAAHGARCAAGRGEDRTAVCQHRGGEERRGPVDAGDARVRTRSPHGGVGRHRAPDGRASRSLARHAGHGRPAGRGRRRRRSRDAERRPVHALSPPGFRAVAARRRHDAGRHDWLSSRLLPRDVRRGDDHGLRPRRPCGDAAQHHRSGRPRLAHRPVAADGGLAREQPGRSGRGDRRLDPRRHAGQHHPGRSAAAAVGAHLHDRRCGRGRSPRSAESRRARRLRPARRASRRSTRPPSGDAARLQRSPADAAARRRR